MAVPVYISNERGATEVCFVGKSSKKVVLVGPTTPGAVPVKPVGAGVRGVLQVVIGGSKEITPGETLTGSSSTGELTSPSFSLMNTTTTNNMGPDGFTWPQGGPNGPIIVDSFGKLMSVPEDSGGNHSITYSNTGGASWSDALSLGFLTRGSGVYNSKTDRLEVCWLAQLATDGILYRRYAPTRDGSNNITGWTAEGAGYAVLDAQTTGTMLYEHPTILFLDDAAFGSNGAILCMWSARNTGVGGTGNEIRAAMRVLSQSALDFVASNWTHIGINSTTTIGNAPGTGSYTAILANAVSGIPHGSLNRLSNKDLFIGYHTGDVSGGKMAGSWQSRRATWASGSNTWTALTSPVTISNIVRAGTDSGSNQKGELLSKIVQDGSGNVYFGVSTWKSNVLGDTWSYAQVTPGDVASLVDVYSANGAHSYAPDGDVEYDSVTDQIVVSYITTSDQAAYIQRFRGLSSLASPQLVFNSAPVDITLIRTRVVPGKLAMMFRDTNSPKKGWFGTLTWN